MAIEKPSGREEQEVNENNNAKKSNEGFDFRNSIDEYIQEKTKDNILFFKGKNHKEIFKDFISFFVKRGFRPDLSTVLLDLQKKLSTNEQLNDFESEIFGDFSKMLRNETISSESLYNGVLKLFDKSYEFEADEYKKLQLALQKEGKGDLQYLLSSVARIRKFLKTKNISVKENKDETEDIFTEIFGSINVDEIKGDEEIRLSLKRFKESSILFDINDLKNVLSDLGDNNEAKKALIKYFVPRISYKDAVNYDLISEEKARKNIKESLSDDFALTDEQKKDFSLKCDLSEFFIETDSAELDDLSKALKNPDLLSKVVKEYKESILQSQTGLELDTIEQFIDQALSAGIITENSKEAFKKFGAGAYFQKTTIDKDGKESKQYFYIDTVFTSESNGKKYFKVKNITNGNDGIMRNNLSKYNAEEVSFEDMFAMLTGVSKSSGSTKIDFYSSKEDLKTGANVEEKLAYSNELEEKDIKSPEELKKILDENDSEGSGVPLEKMAFRCKPRKKDDTKTFLNEEEVYFVRKVENGQITLDGNPPMSFADFALVFAERKCKRFKKMDTDSEFFEALQEHENLKEGLEGFEFNHGKIVPKGYHGDDSVKYLVASDGTAINVSDIGHTSMSFETGKYTEKEDKEKNTVTNTFSGDKKGKGYDFNTMYLYLTSKKFKPVFNKEVEEHHDDHDEHGHGEHLHKHGSLFKSYMSCLSIHEIGAGLHHIQHTFEHWLKFGSDLRAAKFARKLGKKLLPSGLFYELQSTVEQEESKHMEAKIKELKGMSTWKMIKEVEHILATSKPFDHELEAALFAVVSKTGVLYPKGLKKYQGSFMWYEALGGKKGDAIYMEFKKECESNPRLPFNEEYLVERLLDYQTDKLDLRRNKFNKQYGNELKTGKKEEEEDGDRKTKNKTTAKGRLDYILDEFENLTYWNGLGAIDNFLAKCPADGHIMGTIPFVVLTSGMSMDFLPEMVNKLFGMAYTQSIFASLSFISNKDNLKKYNDYVARVIELKYGEKSDQYTEFKKISKGDRQENIKKAREYWAKYGKDLFPLINMTNGFVVSQKDKDENKVLSDYYNIVKSVQESDDFKTSSKVKEQIEGGFADYNSGNGASIASTGAGLGKIKTDENGNFVDTRAKKLALMNLDYIKGVINDESIDIKDRERIFKTQYRLIERQIASVTPKFADNFKKTSAYQDMVKYSFFEVFPGKFSEYQKKDSQDALDYDKMLDEKWKKFLNLKTTSSQDNEVADEVENVRLSVLHVSSNTK